MPTLAEIDRVRDSVARANFLAGWRAAWLIAAHYAKDGGDFARALDCSVIAGHDHGPETLAEAMQWKVGQ